MSRRYAKSTLMLNRLGFKKFTLAPLKMTQMNYGSMNRYINGSIANNFNLESTIIRENQ